MKVPYEAEAAKGRRHVSVDSSLRAGGKRYLLVKRLGDSDSLTHVAIRHVESPAGFAGPCMTLKVNWRSASGVTISRLFVSIGRDVSTRNDLGGVKLTCPSR